MVARVRYHVAAKITARINGSMGRRFITVMLWQLVSHLRIRGRTLRGATELENEAVLVKWKTG